MKQLWYSSYLRIVLIMLFVLSAASSQRARAVALFDANTGRQFIALEPQASPAEGTTPQPTAPHQLYLPLLTNGAAVTTATARLSTPQLLAQAVARGEISADERILYLAYALYEPASLPAQFYSNVG